MFLCVKADLLWLLRVLLNHAGIHGVCKAMGSNYTSITTLFSSINIFKTMIAPTISNSIPFILVFFLFIFFFSSGASWLHQSCLEGLPDFLSILCPFQCVLLRLTPSFPAGTCSHLQTCFCWIPLSYLFPCCLLPCWCHFLDPLNSRPAVLHGRKSGCSRCIKILSVLFLLPPPMK